ncbi:RdRP-domain-containing protein [Schizophyllum commune H4-8]|uniref:RdRP-domain-containing protein n=1 Tax=Schizophyllum commune (strain H4-8 / FGSC 9210) TaxID=578458 RepID=UPI0021607878|nr:RdRP-domain-containing protein [Schizophyllum commune H4-8]KAI5891172.1 RdRP-domain-containing protein [Schizophyllum commune H4-8]
MDDVSDFVVDYINNDVLGVVAITWLIIADQSSESIFDKDCLKLSQLHSDAVDFPKSGQPVELRSIPRLKRPDKKRASPLKFLSLPDWNAPEVVTARSSGYYESQRAIGRLHRAITLPALKDAPKFTRSRRDRRRGRRPNEASVVDWSAGLHDKDHDDPVVHGLSALVPEDYDEITVEQKETTEQLFQQFANELRGICSANALSQSRAAMLTEEEAVVGTIVQQTSQPRKRKDHMTRLRDQTDILVKAIRDKLEGDDGNSPEDMLRRAWHAWLFAYRKQNVAIFGAHSFGWVALGVIFEALKEMAEEKGTHAEAHTV